MKLNHQNLEGIEIYEVWEGIYSSAPISYTLTFTQMYVEFDNWQRYFKMATLKDNTKILNMCLVCQC